MYEISIEDTFDSAHCLREYKGNCEHLHGHTYKAKVVFRCLTLDKIGIWTHLVAVLDGKARQAVQYVNGFHVSHDKLKFGPPFRIGSAELGNWNRRSDANPVPSLIRNLSGSLDEFEVFSRALSDVEVRGLYAKGKPDLDQ